MLKINQFLSKAKGIAKTVDIGFSSGRPCELTLYLSYPNPHEDGDINFGTLRYIIAPFSDSENEDQSEE